MVRFNERRRSHRFDPGIRSLIRQQQVRKQELGDPCCACCCCRFNRKQGAESTNAQTSPDPPEERQSRGGPVPVGFDLWNRVVLSLLRTRLFVRSTYKWQLTFYSESVTVATDICWGCQCRLPPPSPLVPMNERPVLLRVRGQGAGDRWKWTTEKALCQPPEAD